MNKSSTSNSQESTHLGSKTESAAPSLSVGVVSRPATLASSGPVPNMSIFTAAANPPASGTSAAGVTTAT
ncbi:U4/U6 small nuclear ribonucleoprotein Prp3-like, partial [Trifolium medium]|nr:U4/U6 small nuclear ribonucleoprotein Prp3-like [Trifolium medium]